MGKDLTKQKITLQIADNLFYSLDKSFIVKLLIIQFVSIVFCLSLSCASKFSINSKTVKNVLFYGSAVHKSSFEITPSGRYYFKLFNNSQLGWGSVGVDLNQAYDLKICNKMIIRAKGRHGGERFKIILRDYDWINFDTPESISPELPEQGLDTKWSTIIFNLNELEGDVDLGYLSHVAIEFGTDTTGNPEDAGILINDITFIGKEETAQPATAIVPEKASPAPAIPDQSQVLAVAENEYFGPPLPPYDLSKSNQPLNNMVTMISMGCVILLGGLLMRKRTNGSNGNGFKPWLFANGKPHEFPRIPAPEGITQMIYEINTRAWGAKKIGDSVRLRCFDRISSSELKRIRSYGFDAMWLMGVWEISQKSKEISRKYGTDFEGSPYAIPEYKINHALGGEEQFIDFVNRAHKLGLKIIVDFVPNHMAMDSRWIDEHPEFFVSFPLNTEDSQLDESTLSHKFPGFYSAYSDNFPEGGKRIRKRIMVAYGKDPNFFPWIDTAQLDYTNPRLRLSMVNLLKYWAKIVDGVRCDTVMLVLREQIKYQWHAHIPWEYFDRLFPEEFWLEAINEVKRINPHFTFIAETYWNKESYLQSIGFDFTYHKTLYDLIISVIKGNDPDHLKQYLAYVSTDFLSKGIHFLENHDEERAINVFGEDGQRAAAVCVATLPGTPLIHQGQIEGFSERLPVHRLIPQTSEHPKHSLREFYRLLLPICAADVFRKGAFYLLHSSNKHILAFIRKYNKDIVIVIVNMNNNFQQSIITMPKKELELDRQKSCIFRDEFYHIKTKTNRARPQVKSSYRYTGVDLMAKGLYVELCPFDAHIFRVI